MSTVGQFDVTIPEEQRQQRALLEIARSIHKTLDLDEVFRALVSALRPLLSFDLAVILMSTEDGAGLRLQQFEPAGADLSWAAQPIPAESAAAAEALERRGPLVAQDLVHHAPPMADDAHLVRSGMRSRVILPLVSAQRPLGVLLLAAAEPDRFPPGQVEFLSLVADQLAAAVANSVAFRQLERTKARLRSDYIQFRLATPELGELVGCSPRWQKVLSRTEMVARTDSTVLILGETGTGKELVARAIHRLSPRRNKPFVAVHCAALPATLIASELFGHERGAFTGADRRRLGRLEIAEGGTLFLDEVAEIPPDVQVQLLRVLQEREFQRVGGTETIRVNVRIVAATNRDLTRARVEGRFRDDLYYRLNVFPIVVPPLRERREDIEPLLEHFLKRVAQKLGRRFTTIDPLAIERCMLYDWPGNVRELENMVERSAILSPGPVFSMDPLAEVEARPASSGALPTFHEAVREILVRGLRRTRGKIYGPGGAAALLGLKPSTLQAKLKRYGIDRRAAAAR